MSELNLVPNPTVVVVQAGIFLAAVGTIKKLILEPYLRVRERREGLTLGSKEKAVKFSEEAELIASKIDTRIHETAAEVRRDREVLRQQALATRSQLLAEAEKVSRAHVERVMKEVSDQVAAERAKIPEIVRSLAQEVYTSAVN